MQRGEYVTPDKLTLAAFLEDEWLPAIRATVRPSTFISYDLNVRRVVERIGSTPLQPFQDAVAQFTVPRIRLHDLRHTWASLALQAGVNPKVVSERLGHATVSFTLDVYSHVMPGLQEDAAATIAALVVD